VEGRAHLGIVVHGIGVDVAVVCPGEAGDSQQCNSPGKSTHSIPSFLQSQVYFFTQRKAAADLCMCDASSLHFEIR
jgi:hypothetical protein